MQLYYQLWLNQFNESLAMLNQVEYLPGFDGEDSDARKHFD